MIASLIDASPVLLVYGTGAYLWRQRDPSDQRRFSRRTGYGLIVLDGVLTTAMLALHGQTVGSRLVGTRVVDSASGDTLRLRRAVLRWVVVALPSLVADLAPPWPGTPEHMQALLDLKPRVDELRVRHHDDRAALNQAVKMLYRERNVNPLGGCADAIPRTVAHLFCDWIIYRGVFRPPLHQGLHDRIANAVVVRSE